MRWDALLLLGGLALGAGLADGAAAQIVTASGGQIRALDRMTGALSDYDLASGQSQALGKVTVRLDECRYPSDLPTGEAFAHLTITDDTETLFEGWMIASSPAVSALDHPRYDVWVLRCDVPESTTAGEGSGG